MKYSKIEWLKKTYADGAVVLGHTHNEWEGCEKVSPACAHCLAPDTLILYSDWSWRPIGEAKAGS